MEPLRWNPYLQSCLHILDEAKDYATDQILVVLVKSQLAIEKYSLAIWYDNALGTVERLRSSPLHHVQALQAELEAIKNGVTESDRNGELPNLGHAQDSANGLSRDRTYAYRSYRAYGL